VPLRHRNVTARAQELFPLWHGAMGGMTTCRWGRLTCKRSGVGGHWLGFSLSPIYSIALKRETCINSTGSQDI
jgi:hypothetical protein